jgi:hypothetical protein
LHFETAQYPNKDLKKKRKSFGNRPSNTNQYHHHLHHHHHSQQLTIAAIAAIASIAAIATQRTQNTLRDMIYQYNQRCYCAFPIPLHQCDIAGHFERRVRMQASGTVGGNAFEWRAAFTIAAIGNKNSV